MAGKYFYKFRGVSSGDPAANERLAYFSVRAQDNDIGLCARSKVSVLREAYRARGVQRGGTYRIPQAPAGESSHVANGVIHGEDAAREVPIVRTLSVFHLDLNRAELVGAVGHAGGGGGVGDENRAFEAHCSQEKLYDLGGDVNSIHDHVGGELAIGKNLAEDAGIAMIERTHGVEGVGGVTGSGLDPGAGGFEHGVGVADAHANLATCRFGDHFEGSWKFGRDGHHADVAARRLPETFKDIERGLDQIFRGMHAAALVTEKRTFQMDAERLRLGCAVVGGTLRRFDRIGEPLERLASVIERRGDGGREVARDSMAGEELVQMRKFGGSSPHDIEAGAAVHVNVDETGREDGVGEVNRGCTLRDFFLSPRGNGRDEAVLYKEERILDFFLRGVETTGAEDDHVGSIQLRHSV
jgi:hypothetical protein